MSGFELWLMYGFAALRPWQLHLKMLICTCRLPYIISLLFLLLYVPLFIAVYSTWMRRKFTRFHSNGGRVPTSATKVLYRQAELFTVPPFIVPLLLPGHNQFPQVPASICVNSNSIYRTPLLTVPLYLPCAINYNVYRSKSMRRSINIIYPWSRRSRQPQTHDFICDYTNG